ncbi:MAG: ATP-binding cassette domain-containing protein [Candidatus Alcyoniella australis]|nr:ATP-binding cassette domain-containing protein [Candidatus Alcyoniella australis]
MNTVHEAAISVRKIEHLYGKQPALRIDELDVPQGKVTALVGPNGSGKSTLMLIAALLMRPTHGELRILGRPTDLGSDRFELRRSMTMVFQRPLLFRSSVADNVAYGLRCRSLRTQEREERVRQALELVGMQKLATRAARGLSGGEAQRVALARALVLETPLLLLDEPTVALDRDFRRELEQLLVQRCRDLGTTVVIATHERGFVRRVAQNVVYLDQGMIVDAPEMY